MDSSIKISIDGVDSGDFRVWTADIHEGISELYRARLKIVTAATYTLPKLKQSVLGKKAVLTLEQKHAEGRIRRYLNGIVTECIVHGAAGYQPGWEAKEKDKSSLMISLVIEPQASLLKSTCRTQDYPNSTPLKVITEVFRRNGIDAVQDGAYISQENYTRFFRFFQQNETDYDFVRRIMAKYGISFSFRHSSSGPEQLYLSDGQGYPACTDFEFSDYSSDHQSQMNSAADAESYDFHMGVQEAGSANFPMMRFEEASALGSDQIRYSGLHPKQSKVMAVQKGDDSTGRVLSIDGAVSSFGLDVDDDTLSQENDRVLEAAETSVRLQKDSWNGETPMMLAIPGKIIVLHRFYSASPDDPVVKSKIISSDMKCTPGSDNSQVFSIRFNAMDFSDDLAEKRFAPAMPEKPMSAVPLVRSAVVCDMDGQTTSSTTVNHICPSPHSTPETPWLFMVQNSNQNADQKCIDVEMTMPLGGKRSGFYRFPRVGDRVLIMETSDHVTLLGYAPDCDTAFSEFSSGADAFGRNAFSMRSTTLNENANPDGRHNEVGFTFTDSAEEYMEQQIVDGTAYTLLMQQAVFANNQKMLFDIEMIWKPRLIQTRKAYFDNRNTSTVANLTTLAKEIVAEFQLSKAENRKGDVLNLYSNGSIFQYSRNGIDIITDGPLNITADSINVNGKKLLNLQSDRLLSNTVANTSVSLNVSGIAMRSLKVVDSVTRYDSAIYMNALDGISVNGTNVNINGLMSACINDAMGGSLYVANGVLMGAGAVVDMATIPLETMNDSFSKLDENSGLNRLNKILSDWKAGNTPDGKPRSLADHRVGAGSKIKVIQPLFPLAKFRGSASPLSLTTGQAARIPVSAAVDGGQSESGYALIPGASPEVRVSENELLRANAFADMMDLHRQSVQTVTSSIMSGDSSSVTIVSHDLELNVENINNLSNQSFDNSSSNAGK